MAGRRPVLTGSGGWSMRKVTERQEDFVRSGFDPFAAGRPMPFSREATISRIAATFRCLPTQTIPSSSSSLRGRDAINRDTMHLRYFIVLPLFAVSLLSGCVILPIPTGEKKVLAGAAITQEQLSWLVPNTTTKKEVIDLLGIPTMAWEKDRLFVYNWIMRQGVLIVAVPYVAPEIGNIPKRYVLLVQFDEQDRIRRFERVVRPEFDSFQSYKDFVNKWAEKVP